MTKTRPLLCAAGALTALILALAQLHPRATADDREPSATRDWPTILGPAAPRERPAPLPAVTWRGNLDAAFAEARRDDRPVFVTLRCLPCKQCSAFDKDVLDGGPQLTPLLRQFVTVRLTSMRDLDLRMFRIRGFQDLDLSWWGFFFSPDRRIYGVYGGRDHISDQTRISEPSLANTLERVLAHHYDRRRPRWDIDGPAPDLSGAPQTATGLPGFASWSSTQHNQKFRQPHECLHCHQVAETLRQPAIDDGTLDPKTDFVEWPLPENVGLTLDRDHGLRVTRVTPDSPAARVGLRSGDELLAAGNRRLFSQADLRGVLHRAPEGAATIDLRWRRKGERDIRTGALRVAPDWKQIPLRRLSWRKSIAEARYGPYAGFWPLPIRAGQRKKLGLARKTMAVKPYVNDKSPAWKAGLRRHHIVVAVNGQSPDLAGRDWVVWFRYTWPTGKPVTLTIVDRGKRRALRYTPPTPQ